MSHSTVEKQRRDRINSLIDEVRQLLRVAVTGGIAAAGFHVQVHKYVHLNSDMCCLVLAHACCSYMLAPSDLAHVCVLLQLRELVPVITPWPKSDQQGEQKRPKHLVLADTITLLKQLQDQVRNCSSGVWICRPLLCSWSCSNCAIQQTRFIKIFILIISYLSQNINPIGCMFAGQGEGCAGQGALGLRDRCQGGAAAELRCIAYVFLGPCQRHPRHRLSGGMRQAPARPHVPATSDPTPESMSTRVRHCTLRIAQRFNAQHAHHPCKAAPCQQPAKHRLPLLSALLRSCLCLRPRSPSCTCSCP